MQFGGVLLHSFDADFRHVTHFHMQEIRNTGFFGIVRCRNERTAAAEDAFLRGWSFSCNDNIKSKSKGKFILGRKEIKNLTSERFDDTISIKEYLRWSKSRFFV